MASSYGPRPPTDPPIPVPEADWPGRVSELAGHLDGILAGLRGLDLDGVAPASAFRPSGAACRTGRERPDAAL
ncbi:MULTISPECIES: hypothetical protein [unclassified Streptomyces]|uniref:hypothetical protein n=1 Tax=unclassified Streptomyces TaxID=2593676 RepID=UPI0033334913